MSKMVRWKLLLIAQRFQVSLLTAMALKVEDTAKSVIVWVVQQIRQFPLSRLWNRITGDNKLWRQILYDLLWPF